MKLWKNLSNRLDAVADVMAAKPCMQGCVGKTLLSIPRTPGNLITAVILAIGLLITIGRFGFGLGAVTNLDDNNPWGIWIAFDLLCGVALAAGGYVTSSACYLFGMKRYHSAVRPAILTASSATPSWSSPCCTTWASRGVCRILCSYRRAPRPCCSKWACAWAST